MHEGDVYGGSSGGRIPAANGKEVLRCPRRGVHGCPVGLWSRRPNVARARRHGRLGGPTGFHRAGDIDNSERPDARDILDHVSREQDRVRDVQSASGPLRRGSHEPRHSRLVLYGLVRRAPVCELPGSGSHGQADALAGLCTRGVGTRWLSVVLPSALGGLGTHGRQPDLGRALHRRQFGTGTTSASDHISADHHTPNVVHLRTDNDRVVPHRSPRRRRPDGSSRDGARQRSASSVLRGATRRQRRWLLTPRSRRHAGSKAPNRYTRSSPRRPRFPGLSSIRRHGGWSSTTLDKLDSRDLEAAPRLAP